MLALLLTLLLACSPSEEGEGAAPAGEVGGERTGTPPGTGEGATDASAGQGEAEDTAATELSIRTGEAAPLSEVHTGERLAARHILISYEGSRGARPNIHRSRKEARQHARSIRQQLLDGAHFPNLATQLSDGPSAAVGGMLGAFEPGTMDPLFEQAVAALPIDGISELVETPYGFHIIQRLELREIRVAHVLVQWEGRRNDKSGRTQEEARQRVEEARAAILTGEGVADVARRLSDGPSADWGGELGWMQKGQMVPVFDEEAFALDVGGVSDIVETPLGYHVLVRLE